MKPTASVKSSVWPQTEGRCLTVSLLLQRLCRALTVLDPPTFLWINVGFLAIMLSSHIKRRTCHHKFFPVSNSHSSACCSALMNLWLIMHHYGWTYGWIVSGGWGAWLKKSMAGELPITSFYPHAELGLSDVTQFTQLPSHLFCYE